MSTSTTAAPISPRGRPTEATSFLDALGPGLATGAADDDPSGIATWSQLALMPRASRRSVMGRFRLDSSLKAAGIIATMPLAAVCLVIINVI